MARQIHHIDGVKPSPVLSHVVEANGFVFIAGTVGSDPATGTVRTGGFEAECRQMLDNVAHLLHGVELDFTDVVRSTVYLTDLSNRDAYNRIYREYFSVDPPARATVSAGLIPPYTVEIECTAARRS